MGKGAKNRDKYNPGGRQPKDKKSKSVKNQSKQAYNRTK